MQAPCTYDSSVDLGTGMSGLWSNTANVLFDSFNVRDASTRASLVPGIGGLADASISAGELLVQETTRGGEAIVLGFKDDDYMLQADVKMNSGTDADLWVRYNNTNNGYRITLTSAGGIGLSSYDRGQGTAGFSAGYTPAASVAVKIKVSGTSIKVWVDGSLKINTTDSTHAFGGVALSGDQPKFECGSPPKQLLTSWGLCFQTPRIYRLMAAGRGSGYRAPYAMEDRATLGSDPSATSLAERQRAIRLQSRGRSPYLLCGTGPHPLGTGLLGDPELAIMSNFWGEQPFLNTRSRIQVFMHPCWLRVGPLFSR